MSKPSSQIIAYWVREELSSTWSSLYDLCVSGISRHTAYSEEEISDLAEENLVYVANHLRDILEHTREDGIVPAFEIDNEPRPYLRSIEAEDVRDLLRRLRQQNCHRFESMCGEILRCLGADATVVGAPNDGGIDFYGTNLTVVPNNLSMPRASRVAVIGQAKRFKDGNIVKTTQLREFIGAGVLRTHDLRRQGVLGACCPVIFAFWTTSGFDPAARAYAKDAGLWYMDGAGLVHYLKQLSLTNALVADSARDPSRL